VPTVLQHSRQEFFASPKRGTDVAIVAVCARIGRGLTKGNLVSTLEQSPVRGGTAAIRDPSETAPASERDDELTNGERIQTCASDVVAKRNEE
jgi:hypothetical protein